MDCPRCNVLLLVSVREDIEIDCCPQCGGIWLDHGELMKIIAAYGAQMPDGVLNRSFPGSQKVTTAGKKTEKAGL